MKFFLALFFSTLSCMANPSHQQGLSYVSKLLNKSAAQTTNPNIVPGYQTASPKEAALDASSIGDATVKETSKNQIAQSLKEISETRDSYKIDPESNLLFTVATDVLQDPEKAINAIIVSEEKEEVPEELHTCDEGGED